MYGFFLDIDGTIFDGTVSQAVIDAITRARAAGHMVFINTSRAYIGMPAQIYDLPFDGFINSFGLEVYTDGRFIYRHCIPADDVRRIAAYAFDNAAAMYFEGEVRIDIHRGISPGLNPKDLHELDEMLGDRRVCKFVVNNPPTAQEKALFSAEYDFIGGEAIAKGHGKAYGIRLCEEFYGIPHENTVAIGDTFLDTDMVTYAGIGVAMGNSTPDLLQHAAYVTRSLADDGVAFAIDCVLNNDLSAIKK